MSYVSEIDLLGTVFELKTENFIRYKMRVFKTFYQGSFRAQCPARAREPLIVSQSKGLRCGVSWRGRVTGNEAREEGLKER